MIDRLLALLLLVSPAAASLCGQGFGMPSGRTEVRIPIAVHHNLLLIQARINGSAPLNFILDTGVRSTLLIEPILLPLLQVDTATATATQLRGLGAGQPIDAVRFTGIAMTVGDLALGQYVVGQNMDLTVLPEGIISYAGTFGKPVAGIIGSEIFSRFAVRINYREKYVVFTDPSVANAPKSKKWREIPLFVEHNKPYIDATLTLYDGSTCLRRWLLDTGSSNAMFYRESGRELPPRVIDAFIGTGLGGSMQGKLGRMPALAIGPFTLPNILTGFPDSASVILNVRHGNYYANIGAEVLSRFHVIFDYPHGKLYLKPNSDFNAPFTHNLSGLELAQTPPFFDRLIVTHVRDGSPAAIADIHVGDTLLFINNTDVKPLSIDEAYGRINSVEPGRRLCITFLRAGVKQKSCFILEDGI